MYSREYGHFWSAIGEGVVEGQGHVGKGDGKGLWSLWSPGPGVLPLKRATHEQARTRKNQDRP